MATWFITGCSTGFGRALADAVLARGDNAVVTARDVAAVAEFGSSHPDTALPLALDVTVPDQVADAVRRAGRRFGGVDVLVNNAGYGYRAAVEEGDEDDVQRLFATNLFGPITLTKAVLPGMRARRRGTIVNISSIGARISPAGSGYYAATKAALEALSASLRQEVAPLGIAVMVVEPGQFRTDFAGRSLVGSSITIDDYDGTAGPRRKQNDRVHGTQPGDPVRGAEAILTAVDADDPPFMLVLGPDALAGFRGALDRLRTDVDTWEPLTLSTEYPA
ncbi:MAG TPA: oxidoreductase [Mycobacteriales bacterium]|jgi:NAD(P)-dependent dehydrogenase (short-subunit alcohol dehydrogenase family)|nr:oxidoreductase [Mycobacteriales bacterium]